VRRTSYGTPLTRFGIALLIFAVSIGVLGVPPVWAQQKEPVKIGVLTDSRGPTPATIGLRDGLQALSYREDEHIELGVRERSRSVRNDGQGWQEDFPMGEEVDDYAGRKRCFAITCHESGLDFTVRAPEEGREGMGYEFAAYSETSPYSALGRVRQKLHRGLATRHVTGAPRDYRMMHDRLSGRITSAREAGVPLVVDGIPLGW
jgi:hypothetical protein